MPTAEPSSRLSFWSATLLSVESNVNELDAKLPEHCSGACTHQSSFDILFCCGAALLSSSVR
jgi:hypothetical protein